MINNLLLGAASLGEKMGDAGIVVLIGVSLVFLILLLLIGVTKLLQLANKWLNKWDDMMVIYRANKAEVKSLKQGYLDEKDDKVNQVYKQLEKGEIDKVEFKNKLNQIKNEYNAKKPEIKKEVEALKAKQKAPQAVQTEVAVEANTEVVTDARLIAVITAAIAVATEQEQAERKVKFTVRSIKHIK